MRWLPAAHPLVHHLRRTLQGEPGLQTLQLTASMMRELTPALVLAAHAPVGGGSDFAMLSTASNVFDAVGRLSGAALGAVDAAHAMPQREVLAAIALLRADLCRTWRIDDLAREVRMSPSHLGRLFRAQVGISPAVFLRQLRADRMAELLATTSLTVGEAATLVGWTDPAVASRSFKQRYGIPPRVYANTYRGETAASQAPGQLTR